MFTRLADLVLTRRRAVLIGSGAVLLLMAVLATGAFSVLKSGGFDDPASGSSRATRVLDRDFGGQANLVLLLTPTDANDTVDSPTVAAAGRRLTTALQGDEDVSSVRSYWPGGSHALRSADRTSGLITMHVAGDDDASATTAQSLIDTYAGRSGAVDVRAGGPLGVGVDVNAAVGTSLATAEAIAVPITLVLLILAFGSVLAALLPLAIGLVAVAGTFAELSVLGHLTDVSIYSVNLTTALGLGLAIDYSLLMVNRFREEVRGGADVDAAVRTTLHTAGRTVLFSSATVAVALAALLLFPVYFLRSFAYAGVGVVLIAMITALVTLPALLAVLGTKVARSRRRSHRDADESAAWRRVATTVMRRPLVVALPVIGVLLVLGSPFLHVTFGSPDDRVLHDSAASRQVGDVLRADYAGGTDAGILAVVQGRPTAADVAGYARRIADLPGVVRVTGPVSAHGTSYLTITGPKDSSSDAAQRLVGDIRGVEPAAGSQVLVGGSAAELVDSKAAIASQLPWALLWICLTTFVLLFLFTGSVVLPLKALLLNALSLTAVFGALVWMFQDGHLSGPLDFTPGPLNTAMLVLMFCIAFGLSMDYEVFLLSRIKEAHDEGMDTTQAVAAGLSRTGRIVTTAAVLLSITFLAFGSGTVSFIQMFGIGTGIAIVLDATVIRGLLVPAFMRVAGELNWWAPPLLRRLHARIGLSENAPPASPSEDRRAHAHVLR